MYARYMAAREHGVPTRLPALGTDASQPTSGARVGSDVTIRAAPSWSCSSIPSARALRGPRDGQPISASTTSASALPVSRPDPPVQDLDQRRLRTVPVAADADADHVCSMFARMSRSNPVAAGTTRYEIRGGYGVSPQAAS